MQVRTIKSQSPGNSSSFNTSGLGEVIVMFVDGGADSMFIDELEVLLKTGWKNMSQAFKDRDLIPDNYNISFGEPKTPEDRRRGYFL